MQAIQARQYGGPDVMRRLELPDPAPGAGQAVVRVRAAGVNPVDTLMLAGTQGYAPRLPFTPGLDAAGVVEAVGSGVEGLAPGERVYLSGSLSGTYAERVLCQAGQLHPLPESCSFSQGAALGVPYAAAYRALFQRGRARPGETVLIHGATGGVGLAALQWAAASGLEVLGTAGFPEGLDLVRAQGARRAFDHFDPEHLQQVLEFTRGRGVDVILEMAAHVHLGRDLSVMAPGGRIVVIGSRGPVEVNPRDLMTREGQILGLLVFNASERDRAEIHAALGAGLNHGTLQPVVRLELPLEDAPRAHLALADQHAYGKVILVP